MSTRYLEDRHLVCLSPYVPVNGIDHAGGDYLMEYLRVVVELGWHVTVIAPETADTQRTRNTSPPWLTVLLSPRDLVPRRLRSLRLLLSGANGMAPHRWLRRLSADARTALRSANVVDLQWMGSVQYSEVIRELAPGASVLATPHDVKSESIGRAAAASSSRVIRVGARVALSKVRRLETRALDACDRVFVFKQQDVATLREFGVSAQIRTAPPLVRLPRSAIAPELDSSTVLFPAAFWRAENDEAARWFLQEVWPTVSSVNPGVSVRFAGSRPSPWLRAQASDRVEITGYLPDLLDSYHGVALVIAPLRRGAGLKFKVAQTLSMGFPIVATSVALEGIEDLVGCRVAEPADDAVAFAQALLACLENLPDRVTAAARQAASMRERLDFTSHMHAQVRAYDQLLVPRS